MHIRSIISALILFIPFFNSAQEFPSDDWAFNDNALADGWDPMKMARYEAYLIDSTKITGMVIVHKGKIVFDYGDIVENSYIASCRKSVLAMLYGKYVENGSIRLDKTIKELGIDDVEGILPVEQNATVQDLISARSGVYHPEGYPGGMQQFAPERGSVTPGSYWLYSNWDFNVAGYVFEQETGKNIYDEIEVQLAKPLGMQDWDRSLQQKQGNTSVSKYLAYPMWFSTRDMARIGLLMLNKGQWQGKQLISNDWVDEMIMQRTSYQEVNTNVPVFRDSGVNFGYGYMWWLFENMENEKYEGAYQASGAMGQAIAVFPAINTVIAFKTKAAYRRSNSGKTRLAIVKKAVDLFTPGVDYSEIYSYNPIELPVSELEKYVGTYEQSSGEKFKIILKDERLWIQPPGLRKMKLIPYDTNKFVIQGAYVAENLPTTISFIKNEEAKITDLKVHHRNTFEAKRIQ